MNSSRFSSIITKIAGSEVCSEILSYQKINPVFTDENNETISRAVIAQSLNCLLFHDLIQRVPDAKQYVGDKLNHGHKIIFDHGALRTIKYDLIDKRVHHAQPNTHTPNLLASGLHAFKPILLALGFEIRKKYPLPQLKMTGYAFCHQDYPESIAQFFVSELHAHEFSPKFQETVLRCVNSSTSPLSTSSHHSLEKLHQNRELNLSESVSLIENLLKCFTRQQTTINWSDYQTLKKESPEMAWIYTEGNSFNHATDRVKNINHTVAEQKALGRKLKNNIEHAPATGISQTAFLAAMVSREFSTDEGQVTRAVPGSFFEFITREKRKGSDSNTTKLVLDFDSSNAQGIFKVTQANDQSTHLGANE